MNLEQIAIYIRQPEKLNATHSEELKKLCDDFPYTAIYPLLYLTSLSNARSPRFEDALTKYAYRLSDRTKLYNLISSIPEELTAAEEQQQVVTQTEESPGEIHIPKELSNTAESPAAVNVDSTEPVLSDIEGTEHEIEPFDYRTTAESVGQDYFTVQPENELIETQNELVGSGKELSATEPVSETSHNTGQEKSEQVAEIRLTENPGTGVRSFTAWLKSNTEAAPETQTGGKSFSQNDIIDRFIEKQPSITRPKAEFFSPPKKAKESLNEDAMPVSETLAKIFTMQGNYPKAIHIYHQLMLAYPEKKTFFAVQIEELKKKITI